MSSHECSIVTLRLSCTISYVLKFYHWLIKHDVIAKSPPLGSVSDWYKFILKKKIDLLVFYFNDASIVNRFVDKEVLWLTRYDVKAKSPPEGAVSGWYQFILKKNHPISVLL